MKTKSGWHKEEQKDLQLISNLNNGTIKDRNQQRKITEEFELEVKINRKRGKTEPQKQRKRAYMKK